MGINIFLAYACTDEIFVNRLIELLNEDLQIEKTIEIYEIDQNKSEVYTNLFKADFVLLMVSSDFLASDYCYRPEMKRAITLHQQGRIRIIPIILRPVYWNKTPFAILPVIPQNAQPITTHNNQAAIFSEIATDIRNIVYDKVYQPTKILKGTIASKSALPSSPNPYYDYTAVRESAMFFGREKELNILYKGILDRQCISLVGIRYIGKSSVLRCMGLSEVQARYGYNLPNYIFIQIDLRDFLRKTRAGFFSFVCDEILSQAQIVPDLSLPAEGEEGQFRTLLQGINDAGFYPILLMDAFDSVIRNEQFDANFFSSLRSFANRSWVSYITASSDPLDRICHPGILGSPFFNIFRQCELGSLTLGEARQLITIPASRAGCSFTPDEVDWILAQAGRHPFFIQRFCQFLFEMKSSQEVDLKQVEERVYSELQPHFDEIWYEAGTTQQKELKREANLSTSQQPKQLELSESALFRRRVRGLVGREQGMLTTQDVKEALDHLYDDNYLESCKLSELNYIAIREAQSSTSVSGEKAHLIRNLLKLAFEHLSVDGLRGDAVPVWHFYNILYYRYFKNSLSSQQTAAQLCISLRQYYRDHEKAIQELLKEVNELENASLV